LLEDAERLEVPTTSERDGENRGCVNVQEASRDEVSLTNGRRRWDQAVERKKMRL